MFDSVNRSVVEYREEDDNIDLFCLLFSFYVEEFLCVSCTTMDSF